MHLGPSELGGIAGLIGAFIVLWDRFYKGRPIASLTVKVQHPSAHKVVCIRIKNTTPYDVAILGAKNRQNIYFLAEDEEILSIVQGVAGAKKFAFMLKPEETRELIVMPKLDGGTPREINKRYVEFVIRWRRGNATWLPQLPILVCSTTHVIRQLGGVA
jgi:hypothetical protein